jgi:hypothetical protein
VCHRLGFEFGVLGEAKASLGVVAGVRTCCLQIALFGIVRMRLVQLMLQAGSRGHLAQCSLLRIVRPVFVLVLLMLVLRVGGR